MATWDPSLSEPPPTIPGVIRDLWADVAKVKKHRQKSEVSPDANDQEELENYGSNSSHDTSDGDSVLLSLHGCEGDPLIPTQSQIDITYSHGVATWREHLEAAEGGWPLGIKDPSIMLKDIPAIPSSLPKKKWLYGRSAWQISGQDAQAEVKYGFRMAFQLSYGEPLRCTTSPHSLRALKYTSPSLLILTLCWSYIFSARLVERQGRCICYSSHMLHPKLNNSEPGNIVLDLRGASPNLLRWLCALVSQKPGWFTDADGDFPPWAMFYSEDDVQVFVLADVPASLSTIRAPSASEAKELLIEFCHLFGLGCSQPSEISQPMPPYTAAFLAALALPFYRWAHLKPQFPTPSLVRYDAPIIPQVSQSITQYYDDLPYYMTLSLYPISFGSIVWSIFWQPQISCNVVSAWLSSIRIVLQPIIETRDFDLLNAVFAHRRPRVSLTWLGISLLGDLTIFEWVVNYLDALEESPYFPTFSRPDITTAAWTGSPQSFLDIREAPIRKHETFSQADILRRRRNFLLDDTSRSLFSWRPFGTIEKKDIELDLWNYLSHYSREYLHWEWIDVSKKQCIQHGFKRDGGRYTEGVPDNLKLRHPGELLRIEAGTIKVAPSKRSTLNMLDHSVQESFTGDRSLAIAAIPGLCPDHPWLKDWRGL
jgi:hypothetical protein